jgi:hypothetical protein
MSGPFGVRMTIISGQMFSRELVVAASTFLSMRFLSIDPVAEGERTRPEFLRALSAFCNREHIDYYEGPLHFSRSCIRPDPAMSTGGLFWLALDPEGEALARCIFEANGTASEEQVYHLVRRLNRIEQMISPPPIRIPFWKNLFSRQLRQSLPTTLPSYQEYRNKYPHFTPEQARYFAWFEALYIALIPWGDTIKNIQSDYS